MSQRDQGGARQRRRNSSSANHTARPRRKDSWGDAQNMRRKLQDGMATALSLDHWSAPPSSKCHCEDSPDLSVNFLCMHPCVSDDDGDTKNNIRNMSENERGGEDHSSWKHQLPLPNKATAARFQEIFVDLCALHAASFSASSRHILDERFSSFLGEGERCFKREILDLVKGGKMPFEARETSAYRRLERMLRDEMGLDGLDEQQEQRVKKMQGLRRESSKVLSSRGREADTNHGTFLDSIDSDVGLAISASTSCNSFASSAVSSETSRGGNNVDARAIILRKVISIIRSDDELFRRFALSHPNRGDPAPSEAEVANILLTLPNVPAIGGDSLCDPSDIAKYALYTKPPLELQQECEAFQALLRPPGHVFVCNASVCDIFCDAFLCPCGIGDNHKITGSIWKRWYRNIRNVNPRLLQHLRGSAVGNTRRGSVGIRGKDSFVPIPMKRYEHLERVATPKHWPWEEFRKKQEESQICDRMVTSPLLVAGEVSLSSLAKPRDDADEEGAPSEQDHLDALMETVKQFTLISLEELRREQRRPRANRDRYLLALPVVGTGRGNAGDLTGQIVESMLRLLSKVVAQNDDVDCVLVCADVATFSHAQHIRWKTCEYLDSGDGHWQTRREKETTHQQEHVKFGRVELCPSFRLLSPRMREHAQELAKLAARGHLSMFIGAGVSMGAGLPSWGDLLLGVEDQFTPNGLPSERMLGNSTGNKDLLAMADWLGILASSRPDRYGNRRELKERIATIIEERSQNPSLLMSLLTSLPVKSIVTQNYDRLIELAFECHNVAEKSGTSDIVGGEGQDDATQTLSVIPHSPVRGANRWLLKMHGCVSSHESIVITSTDYRNYESGRKKALAGLVQANLMTTHLLFVGFSLSDPNYLRIIEEVRHALKPGQVNPSKGVQTASIMTCK